MSMAQRYADFLDRESHQAATQIKAAAMRGAAAKLRELDSENARLYAGFNNELTPGQYVDAALDSVLKASGSSLKHCTMPSTLDAMRKAMHKVLAESYINGSNDCFENIVR